MRYPDTAMWRVNRKSRDDDEKVTYKSRVKRRVFHFLLLPGFLIKILLVGYILLPIIDRYIEQLTILDISLIDSYPKTHLRYRLCVRYLDSS